MTNALERSGLASLLSVEELAQLLRVPVTTLYDWRHRQGMPALKVGNRLRFDPMEVRRWIDARWGREAG
jgi:excisionase family DNA binding protein